MDEFTDGQDMTEDTEQIINDTEDFGSETESSELEQISVPSSPAHEDTELEQNNNASDTVEQSSEPEPTIEASSELSYDDLIAVLTEQNEEIKAIHELEDKRQEFYTTYQNMMFTLIVGIGLLFGGICAIILSNYLRHG